MPKDKSKIFYTDTPINYGKRFPFETAGEIAEREKAEKNIHAAGDLEKHVYERSSDEGWWDYVVPKENNTYGGSVWGRKRFNARRSYSRYGEPDNDTPAEICSLWKDCRNNTSYGERNRNFKRQAFEYADVKDSYPAVGFMSKNPVYANMDIRQLRSYFSVRENLRHGIYPEVSISYILLYVYETILGVKVRNPEHGMDILDEIYDAYKERDASFRFNMDYWRRDYAIYHFMPDAIKRFPFNEIISDGRYELLLNPAGADMDIFFDTALVLSGYSPSKSKFYCKYPEKMKEAFLTGCTYAALFINKREDMSLLEWCFGRPDKTEIFLFSDVPFYDPDKNEHDLFKIDEVRYLEKKGNRFFMHCFPASGKNPRLRYLIVKLENAFREAYGEGKPLMDKEPDEDLYACMKRAVKELKEKEYKKLHPPIKIDMSKLSGIRSDAEIIKEALMTDEEMEEIQVTPAVTYPETEKKTDSPFTDDEREFLKLILNGGDERSFLKERHIMPGVMLEKINEIFLDIIGDTALEEDNGRIVPVEDYTEDIRDLIS